MTPDLICPACRKRTEGRIDVRTLDRAGDVLACACGRRYPIVDGVPVILAEPGQYLRREIASVVERELPPEVAALLAADGPDDASYPRLLEHLSIYLDAHWGDRATPPADFALRGFVERLGRLPRVELAVELGCSVGRILGELSRSAARVVGVDMHFGALRRARRLLDGEAVAYARRLVGWQYTGAVAAGGDRTIPAARRTLACADVLDPPLVPGAYDRVVALNLLDSVRSPRQLLSVVDELCAPDGEVILSSPYAWQSGVMDEHERLGGADPAAAVAGILREGAGLMTRYRIEEEDEVQWALRRDARTTVTYRVHFLRARKLGEAASPGPGAANPPG
jgi:2-polyprenyl-3-methyl-5-hydroxy-6-metoxy-1,4-benzoquinol methylase/uncharacterized protein YbaR (Trm112 family)